VPLHPSQAGRGAAESLLAPHAVMQTLHAFPVAGSQIGWGSVLLPCLGAVCIAHGARALVGAQPRRPNATVVRVAAQAASFALIALLGYTVLYAPFEGARARYDAATSLALPGAERVRVSPDVAATYQSIARDMAANCPTTVMMPGMNSFYLWAKQEPPTGWNAGIWMALFDDALQERVVQVIRKIDSLCLLRNDKVTELWTGERTYDAPLVRYLSAGFAPLTARGSYELLKRVDAR
jgi:hypothetical protein